MAGVVGMDQIEYRGRYLQVIHEFGYRVAIYRDGLKVMTTAANFEQRDHAIAAAMKLVDDEIEGISCL